MKEIQTWHERAMKHPDHQTGMVSEGMIRARMCEEIADLRAEVERLTRERDEARARASKLWAVLEVVRDADNDCRVEGWATIPDAVRRSIDEALKASSCDYPDCVDLGPHGKCTKWLLGKCDPTLEAKP